MKRALWLLGALALVGTTACRGGCRPEPAPPASPVVQTPPPAPVPPPPPPAPPPVTIREIGVLEYARPLDTIAVADDGRLAVFVEDGTVALHALVDGDEPAIVEATPQSFGGRVIDAAWLDVRELIALDVARDALLRFDTAAAEWVAPVEVPLGGDPRDLWVDRERRRAWVLQTTDVRSEVVVFSLPERGRAEELGRFEVGTSPIALYPSPDATSVAVPAYRGQNVVTFAAEPPSPRSTVETTFRPAVLSWTDDTTWLTAPANLTTSLVAGREGAPRRDVELPAPMTVLAWGTGGVYAFSAPQSVLYRLDRAALTVVAEDDSLTLATLLHPAEGLVAAIDAQELGRIVLLDALNLDVLATWPLTGHPTRIQSFGNTLYAMCPNERRIAVVRFTDQRLAPR